MSEKSKNKGYEVSELAEDLVDFADLLLVLQVHGGVEVGHLVFLRHTPTHNVVFTRVHELPQCYTHTHLYT